MDQVKNLKKIKEQVKGNKYIRKEIESRFSGRGLGMSLLQGLTVNSNQIFILFVEQYNVI